MPSIYRSSTTFINTANKSMALVRDVNNGTVCTYTIYSFHFYFILAFMMVCNRVGIPNFISSITSMFIPPLMLKIIVYFFEGSYVNLTDHSKPNHPHNKGTTVTVISYSVILGAIFASGIKILDYDENLTPFALYLILLSFFHFSEYFVTSLTNPVTLEPGLFLLDNSYVYIFAMLSSIVEYFVELYYFPTMKSYSYLSKMGLTLSLVGEIVRKLAICTAGESFNHTISTKKSDNHKLIRHGIYSISRHPSYAGWFYWALGTQVLLLNPISFLLFALISLRFFKNRILFEEAYLLRFFGDEYAEYKLKVPTGIPTLK